MTNKPIFGLRHWLRVVWFREKDAWHHYKIEWCVLLAAALGVVVGFLSVDFLRQHAADTGFPRLAASLAGGAAILGVFGDTTDKKYTWRLTPWGVAILAVLLLGTRVTLAEVDHAEKAAAKAEEDSKAATRQIKESLSHLQQLNEDAGTRLKELETILGDPKAPDSTLGRLVGLRELVGPPDGTQEGSLFGQLHGMGTQLKQLPNAQKVAGAIKDHSSEIAAALSGFLEKPLTTAAASAKPQVSKDTMQAILAPIVLKTDLTTAINQFRTDGQERSAQPSNNRRRR
jgi:hypothetical protein